MNIKNAVTLITGAAGGIGRSLALELVNRKAGAMALVDRSDTVHQVSRAVNELAQKQLATGYVGDVTDGSFRRHVYDDMTSRHTRVNVCVPAAGITRDSLSVKIDKQTQQVSIYPIENFREVMEINLIAPIYWALEMVAGIAQERAQKGLKRWEPIEPLHGAVVFIGSVSSLGNKGQIAYASTKAGLEGQRRRSCWKQSSTECVALSSTRVTPTPLWYALWEKNLSRKILSQELKCVV
jgi:NAD(P)-dependent dehydrogenase (short-subunit alcohol dehydrogenase family)